MKGYQFRRQRPVLNYIADFMRKELKLIIEVVPRWRGIKGVDRSTHQWEETAAKDLKKAKDLIEAGFKVLRFTDEEVLRHIESVGEREKGEHSRFFVNFPTLYHKHLA